MKPRPDPAEATREVRKIQKLLRERTGEVCSARTVRERALRQARAQWRLCRAKCQIYVGSTRVQVNRRASSREISIVPAFGSWGEDVSLLQFPLRHFLSQSLRGGEPGRYGFIDASGSSGLLGVIADQLGFRSPRVYVDQPGDEETIRNNLLANGSAARLIRLFPDREERLLVLFNQFRFPSPAGLRSLFSALGAGSRAAVTGHLFANVERVAARAAAAGLRSIQTGAIDEMAWSIHQRRD